jgi:hypothetical protein
MEEILSIGSNIILSIYFTLLYLASIYILTRILLSITIKLRRSKDIPKINDRNNSTIIKLRLISVILITILSFLTLSTTISTFSTSKISTSQLNKLLQLNLPSISSLLHSSLLTISLFFGTLILSAFNLHSYNTINKTILNLQSWRNYIIASYSLNHYNNIITS